MKIQVKKALVLLLAAVLLLPFVQGKQAEAASTASVNDTYDTYFTDRYELLDDQDHVYRTLTYHELDFLLDSDGTYVVLFGGAWDEDTQAVIGYINEVAKAAGVPAIHNFDPRLDGNEVDLLNNDNNPFTRRYVQIVENYLTNLADHASSTEQIEFSDTVVSGRAPNQQTQVVEGSAQKVETPFLFVYNREHEEGEAPIIASLEKIDALLTDGAIDHSKADAYKAQVEAVFAAIPGEADVLQNNDYISASYNEFARTTIFDESDLDVVIEPVTYDELQQIFESEGTYALIFGCSWCGNTQAAIKFVNQYAKKYNIDTVYNWDTKLDGGIGGTPGTEPGTDSTNFLHTRNTGHAYAHLYVDLVNTYLTNIETLYDKESNNVTYTDADGNDHVANKLQVPYVFLYNKDHKDAEGNAAPIIGHVELMYSWTNIQPTYERNGRVGVNYNNYTEALDQLYSTLSGAQPQDAPTGISGVAPTSETSEDGVINGLTEGLEYKRAEDTAYEPVTDSTISGLAHGTYYVRAAATDGLKPSPSVIIDLNLPQAAPAANLTGHAPTSVANNNGQITGETAGLEYKLVTADGDYRAATDAGIQGLEAGTYYVRTAAKYGFNASEPIEVTVPAFEPATFDDVSASAWYYPAISNLANLGIITSDAGASFQPDTAITTDQIYDLLAKAFQVELTATGANSTISRQDLFTQVYQVLQALNKLPEASTTATASGFSDASEIAGYALEAVEVLVQGGIIQGSSGQLRPTDLITKAEAAQVISNLLAN